MEARIGKTIAFTDLEDRANSLTHAVGAGFFLAGLALLAVLSARSGDPWKIVSVCVYGATLVLLFSASALYHSVRSPRLRKAFRVLDHVSIHLLIAGTYTPFALVTLRGPWGWSIFGVIWSLALAGVVKDLFLTGRFKGLSTVLFLLMGWLIVVAIVPLVRHLPSSGLALLLIGGLAYSVGAVFYLLDKKLPFGHAVWHLFVLGGGVCHFLSVVFGVLAPVS
ncbi:MAG TPA: hemolysin III family protein [Fibrobacteria bacterium]|nr:hemolysin III family protein [Fibrobacteria bacterium]HOX51938.1 hemolysin III family protein [Fibrobacteria bacterium]